MSDPNQVTEAQLLKALVWCLENSATLSGADDGNVVTGACGCCSSEEPIDSLDPDVAHVLRTIQEAQRG